MTANDKLAIKNIDNKSLVVISIIIPVYNVKKYLDRCLKSVLAQTYTNLEIIIVDDGSTDGSGNLCDDYALIDSRIVVVHQKNSGLSSARNTGLDIAKGNYLLFVDSDDWIGVDFVSYLYNKIQSYSADIVSTRLIFSYEKNDTMIYKHFRNMSSDLLLTSEKALEALLYRKILSTSAAGKLYKADLFAGIRFPVGKIYEDFGTIYKVFDSAKNVLVAVQDGYYYYQRQNSIINSSFKDNDLDAIQFAYEQQDYLVKKYNGLRKAIYTRIVDINTELLSKLLNSKNNNFDNYKRVFFKNIMIYGKYAILNSKSRLKLKFKTLFFMMGEPFARIFIIMREVFLSLHVTNKTKIK